MNEGIVFGYLRSTSTGSPIAGATVTLDAVETTQEINMGRLKLYDVYENELVPPRTPSSISGRDGRFAAWFRWDELTRQSSPDLAVNALVIGVAQYRRAFLKAFRPTTYGDFTSVICSIESARCE